MSIDGGRFSRLGGRAGAVNNASTAERTNDVATSWSAVLPRHASRAWMSAVLAARGLVYFSSSALRLAR